MFFYSGSCYFAALPVSLPVFVCIVLLGRGWRYFSPFYSGRDSVVVFLFRV